MRFLLWFWPEFPSGVVSREAAAFLGAQIQYFPFVLLKFYAARSHIRTTVELLPVAATLFCLWSFKFLFKKYVDIMLILISVYYIIATYKKNIGIQTAFPMQLNIFSLGITCLRQLWNKVGDSWEKIMMKRPFVVCDCVKLAKVLVLIFYRFVKYSYQ